MIKFRILVNKLTPIKLCWPSRTGLSSWRRRRRRQCYAPPPLNPRPDPCSGVVSSCLVALHRRRQLEWQCRRSRCRRFCTIGARSHPLCTHFRRLYTLRPFSWCTKLNFKFNAKSKFNERDSPVAVLAVTFMTTGVRSQNSASGCSHCAKLRCCHDWNKEIRIFADIMSSFN